MPNLPSFQDRHAKHADEIFTGRDDHLSLFSSVLTGDSPAFTILNISGQGGVGKTTLLKAFRRTADKIRDKKVLTASADEHQTTITEMLAYLAIQFERDGYPLKTFDERYRKYRELTEQAEADLGIPSGIADAALHGATRLLLPVVGDKAADLVSGIMKWAMQKLVNKDEIALLKETDLELTRHLLMDLNKHAEGYRVVLLFDTFEKTSPYLETWLINLLKGEFGELSGNIMFVIAGRYRLGEVWTEFKEDIKYIELHEFTHDEARTYLARVGKTDSEKVDQLLTLSDRLPGLLALLVAVPGDDPVDMSQKAVERFLKDATREERKFALAACVPRIFDQDVLSIILDREAADSAFEWLDNAPFVQRFGEGKWKGKWVCCEPARRLMLRYFRSRSGKQCVDMHANLADYYHAQVEVLSASEVKHYDDMSWRKYEFERLYHDLSKMPSKYLGEALAGFLESHQTEVEPRPQDYALALEQVYSETDNPFVKNWPEQLRRLISPDEVLSEWVDQSIEAATFLCEFQAEAINEYHRSQAHCIRGRIHRAARNYSQALKDFSRAIELHLEGASNYYWRGRTYLEMEEYDDAVVDFGQAITYDPQNADNRYWQGRAYFKMKDYPSAVADFEQCIERQPDKGDNYYWLGCAYIELYRFADARAAFTHAFNLPRKGGYDYEGPGYAFLKVRRYNDARFCFQQGVEFGPDESAGDNYRGLGRAYLKEGEYDKAWSNFDTVITSLARPAESADIEHYYWRGRAAVEKRDYSAALNDFRTAIDLQGDDSTTPEYFLWLGLSLLMSGSIEAAEATFSLGDSSLDEEGRVAYLIAAGYVELSRHLDAYNWLRQAFSKNTDLIVELLTNPVFNAIRETTEFQDLIAQFNMSMSA